MDPIDTIPNIITNNGMIRLIQRAQIDSRIQEGLEKPIVINTTRVWETRTPHAQQLEVPVVLQIGKPIVDMPGCVKVNKENVKNPRNKNKELVNDDPKQNVVLCDGGMPYYEPPDYQYNKLTWTTVNPKQPEADGINSETPDLPTPELPGAPDISPTTAEEKDCPGPGDLRVGDYATSGNEKVVGHEWNDDQTKCITLWEDVGFVEKYLPSPQIVTTTATIAVVATSSALLAKPIADLLMKVVKPVVKKLMAKVQKILGKTPRKPTLTEKMTDQYREKKGLLPMKRKK